MKIGRDPERAVLSGWVRWHFHYTEEGVRDNAPLGPSMGYYLRHKLRGPVVSPKARTSKPVISGEEEKVKRRVNKLNVRQGYHGYL